MAIQVTGSLANGFAIYQNPQLQLVPHLTYRGSVAMDVHIVIPTEVPDPMTSGSNTIYNQVGTIPMYPNVSDLVAPSSPVNPYADLIYSLETYVISQLQPANPGSTFTRF